MGLARILMILGLMLPLAAGTELPESRASQDGPRPRRGETALDPMFTRADEALALFYRFVEGIGRLTAAEVEDFTRTAVVVHNGPDSATEEQTIRFLSHHHGMTMRFSRPDRILAGVDLLVNWSLDDLRNTFGDRFKRRMVDGRPAFDFGWLDSGRAMVALTDQYGNIRTIRFTGAGGRR